MKRLTGILVLTLALFVGVLCTGCASQGSPDSAITVTASGKAMIAPDSAETTIVAATSGTTYEEAQANAQRIASDISARIKTAGVPEGAISVTFTEPEAVYGGYIEDQVMDGYWDWDGNWIETEPYTVYYDMTGEITSFDITATIDVSEVPMTSLSTVLKEAVAAGATDFTKLGFAVSDRDVAYQAALTAAVDAAHSKAEALAEASKVYVGRVVNMQELSDPAKLVLTTEGNADALDPANLETLDIATAEVPVEASVTVSYAIS